jgi:colanic acid/amylovoran biosynthesis glycosyltransferase
MIASHWSGIPWSFTAHRGGIVSNNLIAIKAKDASFARYISEVSRTMMAEVGADTSPERGTVIHMGVALPADRPSLRVERPPFVAVCPGTLRPVKGHEHLLHALAILKREGIACTIRIAGDGPIREKLERMAEDLRLGPMAEFLGHVPHDEILRWYGDGLIDAVVLPSVDLGHRLHEGIPVSLMEAMAYGIPVISTTTGGIPELLHDGAGILVPPRDPAALAGALRQLIAEPVLAKRIGELGWRRIEQEFNVEKVVTHLIARIRGIKAAEKKDRGSV